LRGGWGGCGRGFGDVAGVGLGGGVFEGEVEVVDEEADVHVRHGDFKFVAEFFLYGGEIGAVGDPGSDGGFLRGGEGHGGRVNGKV
jgi:hypothetical protein